MVAISRGSPLSESDTFPCIICADEIYGIINNINNANLFIFYLSIGLYGKFLGFFALLPLPSVKLIDMFGLVVI